MKDKNLNILIILCSIVLCVVIITQRTNVEQTEESEMIVVDDTYSTRKSTTNFLKPNKSEINLLVENTSETETTTTYITTTAEIATTTTTSQTTTTIPVATTSLTAQDLLHKQYNVPQIDTNFKAYMDYRSITNRRSEQWRLQQQAYTDEYGLRKVDDYYCIAMGSYYAQMIGDKFKITLGNGVFFYAIIGDFKADRHTNSTNQYTLLSGNRANVIEFIVDTYALDRKVRQSGTISSYEKFAGNIKTIERIETV